MSKSSKRLSLTTETLRTLSGAALDLVVGGDVIGAPITTKTGGGGITRTTQPPQSSCFGCRTQTLTTGDLTGGLGTKGAK